MTIVGYGALAAAGLYLLDKWIKHRVVQGLQSYHALLEASAEEAEQETEREREVARAQANGGS